MIRLSGVSRCFVLGDQQIKGLDGVDLAVAKGEYLAVMGPSGSSYSMSRTTSKGARLKNSDQ